MHYLAGAGDGQTPLDADEAADLIPSWVATRADLDRVEQDGIVQTIAWARGRRLKAHDILSEPFVRQLHKRMFGDAWKWAGHYRTTNKNIGVDRAYIIEEIAKLIADARYWVDENSFAADEPAGRLHPTLASPPTSLLGHSAARSSHGARNSRTIVRLRGGNTSRRFAKPTPETLHRSWPSRDASARIEIRLVLTDPVARRNDGRLRLCGLLRQLGIAVTGFKTPVPPANRDFSRRELSFDTPRGRAGFPCKSAVTEFTHPTGYAAKRRPRAISAG